MAKKFSLILVAVVTTGFVVATISNVLVKPVLRDSQGIAEYTEEAYPIGVQEEQESLN